MPVEVRVSPLLPHPLLTIHLSDRHICMLQYRVGTQFCLFGLKCARPTSRPT